MRSAQLAATLRERDLALADLNVALNTADALAPATLDTQAPVGARFVDQCTVATMAATVYARLGDLPSARALIDVALRVLGEDRIKTRAMALTEAAVIAASTGDVDLVSSTTVRAANLANQLECTPAQRTLRTLPPLLMPLQSNPAIRELLGLLAEGIPLAGTPTGPSCFLKRLPVRQETDTS